MILLASIVTVQSKDFATSMRTHIETESFDYHPRKVTLYILEKEVLVEPLFFLILTTFASDSE